MENVAEKLRQHLDEKGQQGRIVSAEHLHDLRQTIQGSHDRAEMDEDFFQERLTFFVFGPPAELPEPRSLIVVAVPVPQTQVVFTWQGQPRALVLPPTYVGYRETTDRVTKDLAAFLEPQGYRVAKVALPLKLLAACSGLGEYGRNNICYVAGMGSFLQLVACYSDLPCPQDAWQEPRMMARCEECSACLRACPTQAISRERFLLRAERCISFHNERRREFPGWLQPTWHNCLEGCLHCQRVCPEDKAFLGWVQESEPFTEEETALLLAGPMLDQLPEATAAKLRNLDLIEDLGILPRNLRAVLERP